MLGRAIAAVRGALILDATAPGMPVVHANAGFDSLTGYAPDEVLGRGCSILLADEHHAPALEKLESAVREGNGRAVILESRRKDGSVFYGEIKAYAVRNGAGEVDSYFCLVDDVTERVQREEELARRAYKDPLTGLSNRAAFEARLEAALEGTGGAEGGAALLFLDLDNFKWVNDALGHHAGDELLVEVAQRLRDCVGGEGTVARLGGDEFAILLEDVRGEHEAIRMAGKVARELATPFPLRAAGPGGVTTGTSVGIAVGGGEGAAELTQKADTAMYQAKDAGKGGYRVYEPGMRKMAAEKLSLETDLRRALEREEFRLYYQPQVDLRTGRTVGLEALLRWEHPEMGTINPEGFLPLAEETGLIVPIGSWVLGEVCARAEGLRRAGLEPLPLAVNLSARQFGRPELLEEIERALRSSGMPPSNLTVEITESVLMDNVPDVVETLQHLKNLGVEIAIDDFGTGYSSLSYLKRFPVDYLKMDRSFVDGLGEGVEDDEVIATGMIGLAHALGLKVIAEGVETERQLERLKGYGCELGQGALFSAPVPDSKMEKLLP